MIASRRELFSCVFLVRARPNLGGAEITADINIQRIATTFGDAAQPNGETS